MRGSALVFWACFVVSAQSSCSNFQAHWPAATDLAAKAAALNISSLQRANDLESLMVMLRRGIPGTEMRALASQVVADLLRRLAAYVLGPRANSRAMPSGPTGRGAELVRTKGKCLDCHRVSGEGGGSASDLTDIRQRDRQCLRRALLEREADIFDSFGGYRWTIQIPDNYLLIELTTRSGNLQRR